MLGYQGPLTAAHCIEGARSAADNAASLVRSARAALSSTRCSLADYLRCVATEERGKSLLLLEAWLLSGSPIWRRARGGWPAFWREYRNHEKKIVAAHAQSLLGPGCPDRWPGFGYAKPRAKPVGREADFRVQKPPMLDMKEASLYVEFNPDLDGGRFISPRELDVDGDWHQAVWVAIEHDDWLLRRWCLLLEHVDEPDVRLAADATRAAFDAEDASQFRSVSGRFLTACGRALAIGPPDLSAMPAAAALPSQR